MRSAADQYDVTTFDSRCTEPPTERCYRLQVLLVLCNPARSSSSCEAGCLTGYVTPLNSIRLAGIVASLRDLSQWPQRIDT